MINNSVLSFFGLLILSGWAICSTATAQHFHCHRCGCSEEPKSKVCLVRTFKQVSIPDYTCDFQETFYPQKGQVWSERNQNDSFVVQRKDKCGVPCLTCNSKCGCQCTVGARPDGCHQSTSVRKPVGSTLHWVPVLKWKKIKCCPSCEVYATEPPPIVESNDDGDSKEPDQPEESEK
jgi:hypothetical protein